MAIKITVKKVAYYKDVAEEIAVQGGAMGACPLFQEGQTFYGNGMAEMPEGFPCGWAWNDIWPTVMTVGGGGSFP